MLLKPSPSVSMPGFEERTVNVLLAEGTAEVLPELFVATRANVPAALEAKLRVIVAEVPPELMTTFEIVMAAGLKVGTKENVAPVRLLPVT